MSRPSARNMVEYPFPKFISETDYRCLLIMIRKYWIPEISESRLQKWTLVNTALLKQYTYGMDEYIGGKFYEDHLEYAPEPYKFYIDAGAYIAGELRNQIAGFKRLQDGTIVFLTKRDWENSVWNEDSENEYFVVLVEDILESLYGAEPEDYAPEPEDLEEWVQYQLETGYSPEGLSEYEMKCLQDAVEYWIEVQADIARGK